MSKVSVWNLDAQNYARHALHGDSAVWVEKNCYIDVWIEALHAAGLEPLAVLPFTFATDFDGDQWTFFKPAHTDINDLYGVSVQELNVYKTILEHALYHTARGRLVFTEADAFWLPDTHGTDYRTLHTKSTIVIESVDVEQKKLGYFHNAGYFQLEGEDFVKTFRLDAAPDPTFMPLFAELVKLDRARKLGGRELAEKSKRLLPTWLARRPPQNPIARFSEAFNAEIEALRSKGLAAYHIYAFATVRQTGACFELSAEYLRWLGRELGSEYARPARHFDEISNLSKTLILKAARAVNSKKPIDFGDTFPRMIQSWADGMGELGALVEG